MEKGSKIIGIDYLRAVMSVFVVFYHLEIIDKSVIFDKSRYGAHRFDWTDLLYFHVLLLAVPVFILVSNYLFALKRPGLKDLLRSARRILLLLCFWPVAYILWKDGYAGFRALLPRSFTQGVELFFSCGYTVYYFFICLIFATILVFLYSRLSSRAIAGIFFASCLFLMAMPWMAVESGCYALTAYWNPVNFIVYPPAALLLSRFSLAGSGGAPGRMAGAAIPRFGIPRLPGHCAASAHQRPGQVLPEGAPLLLLAAGVVLARLEWKYYPHAVHFLGQGHAIPMYTRPSLVFFSSLLLLVALRRGISPNPVVSFMAEKSLALYCLHPFIIGLAERGVARVVTFNLVDPKFIAFIVVILFSYLGSVLLSVYLKKEVLH